MTRRARQVVGDGRLSPVLVQPMPEPGPGELLLRVHATSVNYHDMIGVRGGLPGLPVPRVPFSDSSATVEALGPGVEGFHVGDAVIPSFFLEWRSGPPTRRALGRILGDHLDGTLQSHLCVPAQAVARAPSHLSHQEIATLGCAGLTAWRSVVVEAGIRPGQTVVIQGTGGVSLFALGFAKMLGARTIITSSSDEKLERARALGADILVNYRRTPQWSRAVIDATDGQGADLIVDVGGGATLGEAVRAVKTGGHLSVIGVLTGLSAPDFPLNRVMARNATLRGVTVGSTADLQAMCRGVEHCGYRPVIDSVFNLETTHEAIEALARQKHFGKIVVEV
ncbi:MAG: NAD(P)-dependent alcohol dehydrogenase [Candidatus Brevundimonas colombiensis]|uniref:NAD(P)-dependent alcohol dehydrogenase n=1 Tax=Candidatus Brevundimonas colombiensis TaxID=3121376 RepID=A0AAJ5WYA1_9CAUL|nr:NAD(P)-dependent alcohol dehydrogenase [Brevundimonas sp.]WEK38474.1 MAG: NAD(P)-dependent alcohol dehydrogenase [Brevundimonas sp.]